MLSTRTTGADRHRGQRGWSLIESLIAAALLGITGVVGLTAWDTASLGAKHATRMAWARCLARSEMEAVLTSPDSQQPKLDDVAVAVVAVSNGGVTDGSLEQVTVTVDDPESADTVLYSLTALKVPMLTGSQPVGSRDEIGSGCPPP